jgi:hypothetical protein
MIDWKTEWPLIRDAATVHGVDPYAVAAIRHTENGGSGREFGVLSVEASTYKAQLEVACTSIRNAYLRFNAQLHFEYNGRLCLTKGFVVSFASRWAPGDAKNDPQKLNANWVTNFWNAYLGFVDKGGVK